MGYRELLYNNNCKIYGKDVVVDELTGDFTKNVIYEGKCDYQPTKTKMTDGTLTQTTPMLYLPYDAKKIHLLSVVILRLLLQIQLQI